MGKYSTLYELIYAVFNTAQWAAASIPTYPVNFTPPSGLDTYIRVDVVASGGNTAAFPRSVSGVLIIDIFAPAGKGNKTGTDIADTLDTYLAGKTMKVPTGSIQTRESALVHSGIDKDNLSLSRYEYSIPFNYYGV